MNTTTTRVKGIPGMLAALPLVAGGEPAPGILLILENAAGVVGSLRWDADPPGRAVNGSGLETMVEEVARLAGRVHARSGILMSYRCEPGAVDLGAFAQALGRRLELHHVLSVTDHHWWADDCTKGCCDGALHARTFSSPQARPRAPLPAPVTEDVDEVASVLFAWERIVGVPASASRSRRRSRAADLDRVLEALARVALRDHLLLRIAPELFSVLGGHEVPRGPVISSRQMLAWGDLVPLEGRGLWLAATSLALWREGDDAEAAATAQRACSWTDVSLARLVGDIVVAGMTYEKALARSRPR